MYRVAATHYFHRRLLVAFIQLNKLCYHFESINLFGEGTTLFSSSSGQARCSELTGSLDLLFPI